MSDPLNQRDVVPSMRLVVVYGTGGGDWGHTDDHTDHWWHFQEADGFNSAWWAYMRATCGAVPFRNEKGFVWTGSIDGVDGLRRWLPWNWFRKVRSAHEQWISAGHALCDYLALGPHREPLIVIAHSHAGQCCLHAAALGREIPVLITVGTPFRADLGDVIEQARPHIGRWVHVFDLNRDRIAIGGSIGDGSLGTNRRQPRADVNLALVNISHSRVLRDAAHFHHWADTILPAAGVLA